MSTNPITFWYKKIKKEIYTYYYILVDPATPFHFKILPTLIFLAYLVFPFDMIPDFIPFLGYVDESVFLLLGISFMKHLVATDIVEQCEQKAAQKMESSYVLEWIFLIVFILVLAIGIGIIYLIRSFF